MGDSIKTPAKLNVKNLKVNVDKNMRLVATILQRLGKEEWSMDYNFLIIVLVLLLAIVREL